MSEGRAAPARWNAQWAAAPVVADLRLRLVGPRQFSVFVLLALFAVIIILAVSGLLDPLFLLICDQRS